MGSCCIGQRGVKPDGYFVGTQSGATAEPKQSAGCTNLQGATLAVRRSMNIASTNERGRHRSERTFYQASPPPASDGWRRGEVRSILG